MSAGQRAAVTTGLLAFVAVHAVENLAAHEDWPFCSYQMYSWVESRSQGVTSIRFAGLLPSGKEFRMQSPEYLFPFDQSRVSDAFRDMPGLEASERRRKALASFFSLYEARRIAGKHSGPRLLGIRLIKTRHVLDPEARNLLQPEEREVLAEVRAGSGE